MATRLFIWDKETKTPTKKDGILHYHILDQESGEFEFIDKDKTPMVAITINAGIPLIALDKPSEESLLESNINLN